MNHKLELKARLDALRWLAYTSVQHEKGCTLSEYGKIECSCGADEHMSGADLIESLFEHMKYLKKGIDEI